MGNDIIETDKMENDKTREPKQKRSIEKKNKIIEAGFQLMCQNGYQKTTTPDIAKAAGVSTGIIYSYFNDKHDIFLMGLRKCSSEIIHPILEHVLTTDDLEHCINNILDSTIKAHEVYQSAHNEIEALACTDPDVAAFIIQFEEETTDTLLKNFIKMGFDEDGLAEKLHIIYNMVESYCHEVSFHKHHNLHYEKMRTALVDGILYILQH